MGWCLAFSLSAAFFLLAAYSFVFYPLSLRVIAVVRGKPVALDSPLDVARHHVALCLCVYNEEQVIREKVENMLLMRKSIPGLDILVYVDDCADNTANILAEYNDRIQVIASSVRRGKTYGMNLLVQKTSAEFIVFTDANVIFSNDALLHLIRPFADPAVGCTLGNLRYVTKERSATAEMGSFYWDREERLKQLESDSGSAITSDGSIFAIRHVLHEAPPPEVSDDIYISLAILCAGYRVVRVADAVAYEQAVSSASEEFRRKVRIACLAFTVHRMLWSRLRQLPVLDLYKYVAHKLLRWLTIYFLGAASLCFVVGVGLIADWVSALEVALVGLALLLAIGVSRRGVLGWAKLILQAFLATGIGVWKSYRGDTFQTWTPPASTRVSMAATDFSSLVGNAAATAQHKPTMVHANRRL